MNAQHLKVIKELEEQGYLVVILDPSQTANLKREDYGNVRYFMVKRGLSEIQYITDRQPICKSEEASK